MSLILDALRKLERDKQSRDPGVVVVGAVPWGSTDPRRRRIRALVLGSLVVIVVVAAAWLLRSAPPRGDTPGEAERRTAAPPGALPQANTGAHAGALHESAAPSPVLGTPPAPVPPDPRPLDLPRTGAPAPATEPPPAPAAAGPSHDRELRLNAISVRDGRPIALLNDRVVREGDSFDGVRILRIGEVEVEVEVDGKRRVIGF